MSIRIGMGPGLGDVPGQADYWRWVDLCERAGIDSIWHSDQIMGATLEPVAMLAALAARTVRMRFGANAVVISQRDPLVLAKQIATIDHLSNGRVLPVFGVGNTNDPYWAATGLDAGDRGRRANEAIGLVRALLEQEEVAFDGAHFRYHGKGVRPKPEKPVPLWIGGQSRAAIVRTASMGDGWLGGLVSPAQAGAARKAIEAALTECGRSIDDDHYGATVPYRIGEPDDPAVSGAVGTLRDRLGEDAVHSLAVGPAAEVVACFRRHVDAGISKFVAVPIAADAGDRLRQTEQLAAHVLPAIEDRA